MFAQVFGAPYFLVLCIEKGLRPGRGPGSCAPQPTARRRTPPRTAGSCFDASGPAGERPVPAAGRGRARAAVRVRTVPPARRGPPVPSAHLPAPTARRRQRGK